ncbi:MAG: cysteine--tRNA ligase [Gammaproteobacteria bacterium]
MLEIYNSLTRSQSPFVPIDPLNVRMYVCGMTVYDYCHIGHARVLVVFDVLYRYLCSVYGREHVTYIRNITDIDDKIIARANENQETIQVLTDRFITAMHEDAAAIGVLPPNEEPRATVYMEQIISMIQALVDKGFAYAASNGDVYYDVSKFEAYGRLSGRQLEDLRAGARVEIDEAKDDPLDFVLWKAAKPGEPQWDSPWGAGRPGWHIECSAMSTHCLGTHFDIHGGGMDLQFPHHENEIAQSCAATDDQFANVWMHNGFVRVDDEKMSKSLGNFFTIREVLKRYDPEVLRYFILTSHYRSPLNYSDQHLENAKSALTTLYTALRGIEAIPAPTDNPYRTRFIKAMDNDLATPEAQAVLFDLAHEINRVRNSEPVRAAELAGELVSLGGLLGLLERSPDVFLQAGGGDGLSAAEIEGLILERKQARAARNFQRADEIRDSLQQQGIVLEDGPQGTTWRRE